ncbi:MAG: ferredoxin [Candidatus Aenigmarchaeota archaeon]|nr:ferredoxin [Candidatus Aenigmarchaeota archaeon]
MARYLVQYERKGCIGAAVCAAVNADDWIMNSDGKADFVGAVFNEATQMWEREIDESQLETMKAAAEGCPAIVIHITNLETGEKII